MLPPILLDYSPSGQELLDQINPVFHEPATRIMNPLPYVRNRDGNWIAYGKKAQYGIDEYKPFSQLAIGDFWELMNLAEFVLRHRKDKDSQGIFKFRTTWFSIEFTDLDLCVAFLFDMEGKWTEWLEEKNASAG